MAVLAGLYGLTLALGQNPAHTPNLDAFASPAAFGGAAPVSGAAVGVKTTASGPAAVAGATRRDGLRHRSRTRPARSSTSSAPASSRRSGRPPGQRTSRSR